MFILMKYSNMITFAVFTEETAWLSERSPEDVLAAAEYCLIPVDAKYRKGCVKFMYGKRTLSVVSGWMHEIPSISCISIRNNISRKMEEQVHGSYSWCRLTKRKTY